MHKQTRNWLVFTILTYVAMFILVPPKQGPKVSPFGFYLGFIQAIILTWFAVKKLKFWKMTGEILIYGIPLLTCLSWIPTTMIFAYFYPYRKKLSWKAGYILFFALGTTIVQHIQKFMGMWEYRNWKTIYTFPVAILTHTIMATMLPLFKLQGIREPDQEMLTGIKEDYKDSRP